MQFGGQTPLKLATGIQAYLEANPIPAASGNGNVKIWGTSPASIDAAEDRDLWMDCLTRLEIRQPSGGTAKCASPHWLQARRYLFCWQQATEQPLMETNL